MAVDFVHGGEFVHIGKEDGGAHNAIQRGSGGFQDSLEIFEHPLGLNLHIAADELLCLRVEGYLSGEKQETVGPNCLRVRTDGLRTIVCGYHFLHYGLLLQLWNSAAPSSRRI